MSTNVLRCKRLNGVLNKSRRHSGTFIHHWLLLSCVQTSCGKLLSCSII